jgi:SAM-dependent methyltransferase
MEIAPASIFEKFSIVHQHRRMLASMGCYLNGSSRILDFGCGDGKLVYEYRDAGFDAYGFEIRPAPIFRDPADEKYFRFALTGKAVNVPEFDIDESAYEIPFEDGYFDFVYSISTFEHVRDYTLALRENARVLRPGGVAIHTFPSRYVAIEPHIHVPFGGAIQNYYWYLFWASLGIRNEFQHGMSAVECARINVHYAKTGLNYLRKGEIIKLSKQHFREVSLAPQTWEIGIKGHTTVKGLLVSAPLIGGRFQRLYSSFYQLVLFLRK